jgi:hypothetical protein
VMTPQPLSRLNHLTVPLIRPAIYTSLTDFKMQRQSAWTGQGKERP